MNLPFLIDKRPSGVIVKRANIGEKGYFDNIEYQLQISFLDGNLDISYYGEDDTFLSDEEILKIIKKLYDKQH
jgi:hypothetical protein